MSLSPVLKHHLFKTYISPVLRSGLSTFVLRNSHIKPLEIFHRKTLRGIMNFSKNSNIAALHFILAELPMEGQIHRDIFSLFYSVWANPDTKIHHIVKYLLQTSSPKSRTWSIYIRNLAKKYELPDPLECLESNLSSKSTFKEHVITKITAYHEKELREAASKNSRMKYFNVSLISLRGQHHTALSNIVTPHEVQKCRIHLKMLCGDFMTYEVRAAQSGGSPNCRTCSKTSNLLTENLEHILTSCDAYDNIRERIFPQFDQILQSSRSKFSLYDFASTNENLCQFLLDPTSINLKFRIMSDDPTLSEILTLSRDLCLSISKHRNNLLQSLQKET